MTRMSLRYLIVLAILVMPLTLVGQERDTSSISIAPVGGSLRPNESIPGYLMKFGESEPEPSVLYQSNGKLGFTESPQAWFDLDTGRVRFSKSSDFQTLKANTWGLNLTTNKLSGSALRIGEINTGLGLYSGEGTAYDLALVGGTGKGVGIAGGNQNPFSGNGVFVTSANLVGIGTSSPLRSLSVNHSSNSIIGLSVNNSEKGALQAASGLISLDAASGNDLWLARYVNSGIKFGVGSGTPAMILTSSGKLGIGTTSPLERLEVTGNMKLLGGQYGQRVISAGNLTGWDGEGMTLRVKGGDSPQNDQGGALWLQGGEGWIGGDVHIQGGGSPENGFANVILAEEGKVGIGTISPSAKLDVAGDVNVNGSGRLTNALIVGDPSENSVSVNANGLSFQWSDGSSVLHGTSWIASGENLTLQGEGVILNGDVGIGTTTPSSKLDVNGTIKATEIIVALSSSEAPSSSAGNGKRKSAGSKSKSSGNASDEQAVSRENAGWPDFVFAPDYDLMSLDELAQAIRERQHLPGMPTASEVAAKGINIGEMQARLLQKIEELTLYVISVKKENDELKTRLQKLER